jgi:hypothetical protein
VAAPAPVAEPAPEIVPAAEEPVIEQMTLPDTEPEPEPLLDLDDLDTPAYLRQGRLLN